MDKPLQKQSFLHGAAVLAIATAIVKLIGAFYKIPLQSIIGEAGYGYFTTAYDIYAVLLTLSTAGLPVAMSRMISASQAQGNNGQIKQIYRASLIVFLTIGIVGSGGMLILCKQLANFMSSPNSWVAIAALSPAVLFVCIISSFRGFFQGQSNMTPTSVSQVYEALCKLIIGLGAAYFVMNATQNVAYAAGAAIAGVTAGAIVSTAYLGAKYRKTTQSFGQSVGDVKPIGATAKELLWIAVPITVGAAGLQIINLIDAKIVMERLVGVAGFLQAEADVLKGIYNFCQTLFNLPAAFIVPLTVSVIPSITGFLTMKNNRGALQVEESAVRIMALLGLPCSIGLAVVAEPILAMLGGWGSDQLAVGVPVLTIFGCGVIFNCMVLLTNAIMQAHGNVTTPLINMLLGGIVKVIVNFVLVGNPDINIVGAPIGTLCCYITITTLNLFAMKKMMKDHTPHVLKAMFKPLVASLVMGGGAWAAMGLMGRFISSNSIIAIATICVAAAVYLVMVLALKIITYSDCLLLPKGEKIAKFLRIH
ncbi:MAG: polysaccharide biosynthesis protein [Eubacteriales bacterium]